MSEVANFGLIGAFLNVFIFILAFVIVYGFLSFRKPFGEDKEGLYGLLAIAMGIIASAAPGVSDLILFLAPWFFIMIFLAFFVIFILTMFGESVEELGSGRGIRTSAIIISIVLLIFGLSTIFGQGLLDQAEGEESSRITNDSGVVEVNPTPDRSEEDLVSAQSTDTDDFGTNLLNTFRNPQVLGMIVLMLIASFAAFFLTGAQIE